VSMPRYYRHILHSDGLIADPEGIELPDLDAARAEALEGIRDLLAEAIKSGKDDLLNDAIIITGDSGRALMTIPFREGLPPRLRDALLAMLSPGSKSSTDH
jgi:hypothetical protein